MSKSLYFCTDWIYFAVVGCLEKNFYESKIKKRRFWDSVLHFKRLVSLRCLGQEIYVFLSSSFVFLRPSFLATTTFWFLWCTSVEFLHRQYYTCTLVPHHTQILIQLQMYFVLVISCTLLSLYTHSLLVLSRIVMELKVCDTFHRVGFLKN